MTEIHVAGNSGKYRQGLRNTHCVDIPGLGRAGFTTYGVHNIQGLRHTGFMTYRADKHLCLLSKIKFTGSEYIINVLFHFEHTSTCA